MKNLGEIAIHAMHERLSFRIAETRVEFEDPGTGLRHHQSGVKEAGEWSSFRSHGGDGGFDHRVHNGIGLSGRKNS
jgi:hypothetical protein